MFSSFPGWAPGRRSFDLLAQDYADNTTVIAQQTWASRTRHRHYREFGIM